MDVRMVTETEGKGNITIMFQEATGHVPVSFKRCMKRLLTQDPVGTQRNKEYLGLQTSPQSLQVEMLIGRGGSELEN